MICPKCQKEIADGLDVCPICGEVLTAPAAEAAPEEVVVEAEVVTDAPAAPKKANVPAIIGMILSILSWLGFGGLLVLPAFILSIIGKKKAKVTGSGKTFATVGFILSLILIILTVLCIVLGICALVAFILLSANGMNMFDEIEYLFDF